MDIPSVRASPRLVAPIAVAAFALALLILVVSSSGGGSGTPATKASVEKQRDLGIGRYAQQQQPGASAGASQPDTYVVKQDDTLASISQQTGVSVNRLEQLNPNVDPQTLAAGERLRLR